jgi:hypothetical protein
LLRLASAPRVILHSAECVTERQRVFVALAVKSLPNQVHENPTEATTSSIEALTRIPGNLRFREQKV